MTGVGLRRLQPAVRAPTLRANGGHPMRKFLSIAVLVYACGGTRVQQSELSGSPLSSCSGIDAPDAVAMQQYVFTPAGIDGAFCLGGVGDAKGTLALPMVYGHSSAVVFVSSNNRLPRVGGSSSDGVDVLAQPSGFVSVGSGPYSGPWPQPNVQFVHWDSLGTLIGDDPGTVWHVQQFATAADPRGGAFFAGDVQPDPSKPVQHVALMTTGGGESQAIKWGPRPLASGGPVYGAGVDLLGRSIAITVSSGNLTGQWFDVDGTALTGEFVLLTNTVAGPNISFETSPLIGGGVVVQRLDPDDYWLRRRAHALVVVESGTSSVHPAPQWMIDRPDTRVQIARGGKAYAVLPLGASNVPCTQRIEVLASDGTSCGARDYPIAAGSCETKDITLGLDGTVIQELPRAMETIVNSPFDLKTCTWRWWPAAVR
jgi:hypothetical protein